MQKKIINPIDKDKVAENPGLLPYAHTVGSPVIKPIDKGRVKGRAMSAMMEQTQRQLKQLYKQMETLAEQAKELQKRVEISEKIYLADINFEPLIGHTYHLYERKDGTHILSLISPEEWGNNKSLKFLNSVKLLSDHTWEVLDESKDLLKLE